MLDEILSLFPESLAQPSQRIVSHVAEVLSSHLKSRSGYFQVTEIQSKDHEYLGLWISIQSWKINDKFHCYWYIRDCRETVIEEGSAGSRDDALVIAQRLINDIDLFFIHHKRSSTRN